MSLVIIESPFSGDVEANLKYLRECMRDALLRGESPYASHGLLTQPGVLDDNIPQERELGIKAGFEWHRVATKMVVYTDRGISSGMQMGIENAAKINLPVEMRRLVK